MSIKYFEDTDTALVTFSTKPVAETRELSENVYLDLDSAGEVVSLTIEHANETAQMRQLTFETIQRQIA